MSRETWLNGWRRVGNGVLIGTGYYCAGCGSLYGIGCVAISADDVFPEKEPDWPFNEADCPVCKLKDRPEVTKEDKLTARLVALRGERK